MFGFVLTLLKSKRVQGAIVSGVASLLLVFGVVTGPELHAWVEKAVEVVNLVGIAWAAYGGVVARGPIVK